MYINYVSDDVSSRQRAYTVRDIFAPIDQCPPRVLDACNRVLQSTDEADQRDAFGAAAALLWQDIDLVGIQQMPWSLRTALRLAAGIGAWDAMVTAMVGTMKKPGSLLATACGIQGDHFWIPDASLLQLDYVLELELAGYGPGFDDDPTVAWAKEECPGIGTLFERFLRWLGGDTEPVRGWVLASHHLMAYPAHGVRLPASLLAPTTTKRSFALARQEATCGLLQSLPPFRTRTPLDRLITAWRQRSEPTTIISGPTPPAADTFLRWRSIDDVMTGFRDGSAHLSACSSALGRLDACNRGGPAGLAAALASTGAQTTIEALRRLIIDVVAHRSMSATYDARLRVWVAEPLLRHVEPMYLCRTPKGLAVHGSCLSTILLAARLCSRSWREEPETPGNWPYQALIAGGWGALIDQVFPIRLRGGGLGRLDISDAPWLIVPELSGQGEIISGPWQPDHANDWYQKQISAASLARAVPPAE